MTKNKFHIIILLMFFSVIVFCQRTITENGIASYYHDNLKGNRTANGEYYDPGEMTAAHLTLPFESQVEVINLKNNKSVIVRINDRGPFVEKRIIDLSKAAADSLDFIDNGLAHVRIKVIRFGKSNIIANHQLLASKSKISFKELFFKANINNSSSSLLFFLNKNYIYSTKVVLVENINPFVKNFSNDSANLLSIFHLPSIDIKNNEVQFTKSKPLFQSIMSYNANSLWAFHLPEENYNENKIEAATFSENINKSYAFPNENNYILNQNTNYFSNVVVKKQIEISQINISGMVYGVQIGSFKHKSNMLDLSEKLKKNYIDKINILEVNKDNIHFYRLLLGEFTNKADAEKLRDKIIKEYPQSFINSFNIK